MVKVVEGSALDRSDNEEHYWVILFDDGRYIELQGTEEYVDNYIESRRSYNGDKRSYRKVKWDD